MANRYDVNIAGYGLIVQTERSAEHMQRLAETLNDRVREIQKSGGTANYLNVVMLAAMELADDVLTTGDRMLQTRKENRELEEKAVRLEEEANRLRDRISGVNVELMSLRAESRSSARSRKGGRRRSTGGTGTFWRSLKTLWSSTAGNRVFPAPAVSVIGRRVRANSSRTGSLPGRGEHPQTLRGSLKRPSRGPTW